MMEINKILQGDALSVLKTFSDKSINMVMTSPPYWALRDYGNNKQLGKEETFQKYINNLCDVFDEIKRILRNDGCCWVNLGDCYAGNMGKKNGFVDSKMGYGNQETINKGVCLTNKIKIKHQLPQKCLVGIPFRFAIEMIERGWILRNTIIWHKSNAMPSSAADRFTIDYEYLFFFVKNKNYWFNQQFESLSKTTTEQPVFNSHSINKIKAKFINFEKKRNKRCVWNINTYPSSQIHFAVYPEKLIETPIKSSCPEEICKKCGEPSIYKRISIGWIDDPKIKEIKPMNNHKPYSIKERKGYVEVRDLPPLKEIKAYLNIARKKQGLTIEKIESQLQSQSPHHWFNGESYPTKNDWLKIKKLLNFSDTFDFQMTNIKYKPAEKLKGRYKIIKINCNCNKGFEGGIVLDPFIGIGTTAVVALKLNRRFQGIELNKEYIDIANKKIKDILNQTNLSDL